MPAEGVPEGPCWVHEVELPGARLLAHFDAGGEVHLVHCARPSAGTQDADWTARVPALAHALCLPDLAGTVLDGVLCAVEPSGRMVAERLSAALAGSDPGVEVAYFVFDLPFARGRDLRLASLIERKRALRELLASVEGTPAAGHVRLCEHVLGAGAKVFDRACELGLEGVVSKRVDSIYEGRRSPAWLEVKCARRMSLIVGGFTAPHGSRRYLGALLVGSLGEDGRLEYRGKVGSGFGEDQLARLRPQLDQLRQDASPFTKPPVGSQARGVSWVRPELVVEVEYGELTGRGKLRHARFKGLRSPADEPSGGRDDRATAVGRAVEGLAMVRVGAPDKLIVPAQGLCKRDLVDYLSLAAGRMLPHVRGRALALVRCPAGVEAERWELLPGRLAERELASGEERELGEGPDAPPGLRDGVLPEGVRIEPLLDARPTLPAGGARCLGVVDGLGLVGLIELDVVEIRTRGARLDKRDCPDRMSFELLGDPSELARVIEAARELRDRLAELGLISFVKTNGREDGLDLVVPVQRRRSYAAVARFCRHMVEQMVAAAPHRYRRLTIHHRLNTREATLLAPYSLRADPRALVSTPLAWSELAGDLRLAAFDLAHVSARLAQLDEDPWEGFFTVRQWVTKASFRQVGINPDGRERREADARV